MKKQYLVRAGGEVQAIQGKAYAVSATSKQEAEAIAKKQFYNEYDVATVHCEVEDNTITKRSLVAFLFMLIPLFLSIIPWYIGHDAYSIRPDLTSTLFATGLYLAFIMKNKGLYGLSNQGLISWILDITVLSLIATFMKILLVTKHFTILKIAPLDKEYGVDIDTTVLLLFAVILSWIGIKIVSVFLMGIVTLFAITNLMQMNEAMHYWGYVYAICAFLGLALYATVEPAFIQATPSFKRWLNHCVNTLGNDINNTKITANNIRKRFSQKTSGTDNGKKKIQHGGR